MTKYYIDVENTGISWLPLARMLTEGDMIALYTSKNTSVHYGMLIPAMDAIRKGQVEIREGWVRGAGDSALDYFLMGEVNNDVMRSPCMEAVIVSNDKGYDDFIAELSGNGYNVRRLNAWLKDASRMTPIKAEELPPVPSIAETQAAAVAAACKADGEEIADMQGLMATMKEMAAPDSAQTQGQPQDGTLSTELVEAIYAVLDKSDADEIPPSMVQKTIIQQASAISATPFADSAAVEKTTTAHTAEHVEGPSDSVYNTGKRKLEGAALHQYIENGLRMTVGKMQGEKHNYLSWYDFTALADAFVRSGGNFDHVQAQIKNKRKRQIFGCLIPCDQRKRLKSVIQCGL